MKAGSVEHRNTREDAVRRMFCQRHRFRTDGRWYPVQTIAYALERDHDRIRRVLRSLVGGRLASEHRQVFRCFADLLQRHLRIEEELLFTAVERVLGFGAILAIAELRREHVSLEASVAALELELARCEPMTIAAELRRLQAALDRHDVREESTLYPIADRLLTPAGKARIVSAMAEELVA